MRSKEVFDLTLLHLLLKKAKEISGSGNSWKVLGFFRERLLSSMMSCLTVVYLTTHDIHRKRTLQSLLWPLLRLGNESLILRSPSCPSEFPSWSKSQSRRTQASSLSWTHWVKRFGCASSSPTVESLSSCFWSRDSLLMNGDSKKHWQALPFQMIFHSTTPCGSLWLRLCNRVVMWVLDRSLAGSLEEFGGSSLWSSSHLTLQTWQPSWQSREWRLRSTPQMIWPNKLTSNMEL